VPRCAVFCAAGGRRSRLRGFFVIILDEITKRVNRRLGRIYYEQQVGSVDLSGIHGVVASHEMSEAEGMTHGFP